MSIECGECERDTRGGHADWCSRYLDQCVGELHDVATTIQADNEGLETEHVKTIRDAIRYLESIARGNVARLAERAARELPDGYEIRVTMEKDAGAVRGYGPDEWCCEPSPDSTLDDQLRDAIGMIVEHDVLSKAEGEK